MSLIRLLLNTGRDGAFIRADTMKIVLPRSLYPVGLPILLSIPQGGVSSLDLDASWVYVATQSKNVPFGSQAYAIGKVEPNVRIWGGDSYIHLFPVQYYKIIQ